MDCGSTSPEAVAASVNTILITLYAGGITGLSGIAFGFMPYGTAKTTEDNKNLYGSKPWRMVY